MVGYFSRPCWICKRVRDEVHFTTAMHERALTYPMTYPRMRRSELGKLTKFTPNFEGIKSFYPLPTFCLTCGFAKGRYVTGTALRIRTWHAPEPLQYAFFCDWCRKKCYRPGWPWIVWGGGRCCKFCNKCIEAADLGKYREGANDRTDGREKVEHCIRGGRAWKCNHETKLMTAEPDKWLDKVE